MPDQSVVEKHTIGLRLRNRSPRQGSRSFHAVVRRNIAPLPIVTGAARITCVRLSTCSGASIAIIVGHLAGGVLMALHSAQGPADGHPADDSEPRPVRLVRCADRRRDRRRHVSRLLRLQHRAGRPVPTRDRRRHPGVRGHHSRGDRLGAHLRHRLSIHPRAQQDCHGRPGNRHRCRCCRHLRARRAGVILDAGQLHDGGLPGHGLAGCAVADRVRSLRVGLFALPACQCRRARNLHRDLSGLHPRVDPAVRVRCRGGPRHDTRRRRHGRGRRNDRRPWPVVVGALPGIGDQPQRPEPLRHRAVVDHLRADVRRATGSPPHAPVSCSRPR